MDRAAIDTDDLLKLVLVLVAVWLVLEISGFLLGALFGVFGRLLRSLLGLVVLVLIVLFLLDRI
ncbi:MAG: hypothetical protein ABEH47_00935 [Haloferacaceae archaeon]